MTLVQKKKKKEATERHVFVMYTHKENDIEVVVRRRKKYFKSGLLSHPCMSEQPPHEVGITVGFWGFRKVTEMIGCRCGRKWFSRRRFTVLTCLSQTPHFPVPSPVSPVNTEQRRLPHPASLLPGFLLVDSPHARMSSLDHTRPLLLPHQ